MKRKRISQNNTFSERFRAVNRKSKRVSTATETKRVSTRNAEQGVGPTRPAKRIVGYKIHRASKIGQPPALDTKTLYNSISVKRVSEFRVRVRVEAIHAKYLEPPAKLHRPFFRSTLEKNRRKYRGKIARAVRGLY